MNGTRKRVSRILALGHQAPDNIKRISRGDHYTCLDGSDEEHEALRTFCAELTEWLSGLGLSLDDLSPEELRQFLEQHPEGVIDP